MGQTIIISSAILILTVAFFSNYIQHNATELHYFNASPILEFNDWALTRSYHRAPNQNSQKQSSDSCWIWIRVVDDGLLYTTYKTTHRFQTIFASFQVQIYFDFFYINSPNIECGCLLTRESKI